MTRSSPFQLVRSRKAYTAAVIALLLILSCELLFSVRHLSQTFDEGAHLYAGYQHWRAQDFGVNPEHPPLVKLVAAAPLLGMHLRQPHPPPVFFLGEEYLGGGELLYGNDADALLWRARVAASLFTLLLALLVFAAGYEMFGAGAGLLALALLAFEPTLLAHGALVTTDVGVTCFIFAAVYAFYRYMKQPGVGRLLLCGLAVGLAFAAKLSGIFIIPILFGCAALELWRESRARRREVVAEGHAETESAVRRSGGVLRTAVALLVVFLMGYLILWAFYGFRYQARPGTMAMVPTLAQFAHFMPPPLASAVSHLANSRLLPEAYIYGWLWIPAQALSHPSFLFGHIYLHGTWLYFPATLLIKWTLPMLFFLLLTPFVFRRDLGAFGREWIVLGWPPAVILGLAMLSHFNVAVRHVLPVWPFAIVIAAAAAWRLAQASRAGAYAVAALLLLEIVSSLHAYPNYLPYANEAFGGPGRTYKLLTDSNVDWGQQAKEVREYIGKHGIRDCWLAYSAPLGITQYYGLPCRQLPTGMALWMQTPQEVVPRQISGTLLVSADDASGFVWGPGAMNPYGRFLEGQPVDLIGNSILVYRGSFDLPLLAAESHLIQVPSLLRMGKGETALAEAKAARELAPDSANVEAQAGGVLLRMGHNEEAEQAFSEALRKAKAHKPDDQTSEVEQTIAIMRRPTL